MIIEYFDDELIEGFKKKECFICRSEGINCKHIRKYQIESGVSIFPKKKKELGRIYIIKKDKPPKPIPQWEKLLKQAEEKLKDKEFWKDKIIPIESQGTITRTLPYVYKPKTRK